MLEATFDQHDCMNEVMAQAKVKYLQWIQQTWTAMACPSLKANQIPRLTKQLNSMNSTIYLYFNIN